MSLKATFICEVWIDDHAVPTGDRFDFDIAEIVREMSDTERDKLVAEIGAISGQNLDFLAEQAGVLDRHNGPFTVNVDEDQLREFIANGMPHRYVVTEGMWGHIFDEAVGEIYTQWVFDLEDDRLVSAVVASNRSLNHATFNPATASELADLEDSIRNANTECLEKPEDWGLRFDDVLPDFAEAPKAGSKRKIAIIAVAFDDDGDDITTTSDLAIWIESAMTHGSGPNRSVEVTAYANLDDLNSDVADGFDPLAEAVAAGATQLEKEVVALDIETTPGDAAFKAPGM